MSGIEMRIGGIDRVVLVDSRCTISVIYKQCCESWYNEAVEIATVNGQSQACEGVASVRATSNGQSVLIDVYVVAYRPLGFDFILGMNGVEAFGGITIIGQIVEDPC